MYETGYEPRQFTNLISNILQTNYDQSKQRNSPSILRKENQGRVPVRDWSRWNYGNNDVIDNYGYGHRGRRGVTMATDDKAHDIKRDGKNSRMGSLRRHKVTPNLPARNSHSKGHHHNINEMSMEEIERKLKNTLEKVNKIREMERERHRVRKRKHKSEKDGEQLQEKQTVESVEHLTSGIRTNGSSENVTKTAESNPSMLPNTATYASLPGANKTVTFKNEPQSTEGKTKEKSGTSESSTIPQTKIYTTSHTSELKALQNKNTSVNISEIAMENKPLNKDEHLKDNGQFERTDGGKEGKEKLKKKKRRKKRHVGPHDGGGLQRLISTGNKNLFRLNMSLISTSVHFRGPIG